MIYIRTQIRISRALLSLRAAVLPSHTSPAILPSGAGCSRRPCSRQSRRETMARPGRGPPPGPRAAAREHGSTRARPRRRPDGAGLGRPAAPVHPTPLQAVTIRPGGRAEGRRVSGEAYPGPVTSRPAVSPSDFSESIRPGARAEEARASPRTRRRHRRASMGRRRGLARPARPGPAFFRQPPTCSKRIMIPAHRDALTPEGAEATRRHQGSIRRPLAARSLAARPPPRPGPAAVSAVPAPSSGPELPSERRVRVGTARWQPAVLNTPGGVCDGARLCLFTEDTLRPPCLAAGRAVPTRMRRSPGALTEGPGE